MVCERSGHLFLSPNGEALFWMVFAWFPNDFRMVGCQAYFSQGWFSHQPVVHGTAVFMELSSQCRGVTFITLITAGKYARDGLAWSKRWPCKSLNAYHVPRLLPDIPDWPAGYRGLLLVNVVGHGDKQQLTIIWQFDTGLIRGNRKHSYMAWQARSLIPWCLIFGKTLWQMEVHESFSWLLFYGCTMLHLVWSCLLLKRSPFCPPQLVPRSPVNPEPFSIHLQSSGLRNH